MKIHDFDGIYQERWGCSWAMLVSGRVTISIFDLTHEMAVNQNMEIVDFSSDLSVQNVCNIDMFVVSGCRKMMMPHDSCLFPICSHTHIWQVQTCMTSG